MFRSDVNWILEERQAVVDIACENDRNTINTSLSLSTVTEVSPTSSARLSPKASEFNLNGNIVVDMVAS